MGGLLAKLRKTRAATLYIIAIVVAYFLSGHFSLNLSFLFIHLAVGIYWINRAARTKVEKKYDPNEEDDSVGRNAALEDRAAYHFELESVKQMLFLAGALMMIFAWGNYTSQIEISAFEAHLNKICRHVKGEVVSQGWWKIGELA